MTPELKLPERAILISHAISSLGEYWKENTESVHSLPVFDHQKNCSIIIPLKMVSVDLPNWASSCGVENQILVPQECVNQNEESFDWRTVDWWLAIFLMLEGWHERVWESIHGSIHSYSYRLKGWDPRVWDHAWVNRICLFLRKWHIETMQTSNSFLGSLPKPEFVLSHDVDAVCKTHPIRLKQSLFHFLNSIKLLLKFRIFDSVKKFAKSIKFFLSSENWWVFDRLQTIEKNAGITAIYHFYADLRPKNFKRWLMDPSYDIKSERLKSLLRQLKDTGHEIGLHPTYDAWNDSKLLAEQKKTLEEILGSQVTHCRQHWLRFSWKDTWQSQAGAGLKCDSTLMFNDRSGFRNSCATTWQPWNQIEGKAHLISCKMSVVMDSHLFDYNDFSNNERNDYLRFWIKECKEVGGKASILWHPQTLTKDYGWHHGFISMLSLISDNQ